MNNQLINRLAEPILLQKQRAYELNTYLGLNVENSAMDKAQVLKYALVLMEKFLFKEIQVLNFIIFKT
jgi:hypothetical protein